jgi:uncharacterized protein YwgA
MLQLTPELLILVLIDAAGGHLKGKTLLQKRAFFLCQGFECDKDYHAHYYGPYSPVIDSTLGQLKAVGFIEERSQGFGRLDRVGFEWRRYEFALTHDGRQVLAAYEEQAPDLINRIRGYLGRMERAGDNGDYVTLSIAAKVFYILRTQQMPMTYSEILSTSKKLGWDISAEQIDRASKFLGQMQLVEDGASVNLETE